MSHFSEKARRLLHRRGVKIVAERQSRHTVFHCRCGNRTFRLVVAGSPKNPTTALIRVERDIERALGGTA